MSTLLSEGQQAVRLAGLKMQEMGVSRGPGPRAPHVQFDHVDGPVLTTRYGEPHWLTLWERFKLKMGWTNPTTLEQDFYLRRFTQQLRKSP